MAERYADLAGPAPAPRGLSTEWPVEWQPVWGKNDSLFSRFMARAVDALFDLAARLPEGLLNGIIGVLARLGRRIDRRHSDAARAFLTQALGDMPRAEREARVLQAYRHFFRVVVEQRRFVRCVPPEGTLERFTFEMTDDARRVFESGEGCVLLTGHIGNWEAAIAAAPWVGLDPVYAVAKPPNNRLLSIMAQRERESRGIRLLPRRGAMRDAPKVIRAGGAIGMLLDQRARKRPVLAPLFGRPARCDRSAGVLMKRLGCPVLVSATTLTDRPLHYRVEFYDCLWPEELAGADPAAIAARINAAYERMIRAHPDQYFWLHDRYKDTPESLPEESSEGAGAGAPKEGELRPASAEQRTEERERRIQEA
jgi:KDO2-lipid IV(A) lauroyltransferase